MLILGEKSVTHDRLAGLVSPGRVSIPTWSASLDDSALMKSFGNQAGWGSFRLRFAARGEEITRAPWCRTDCHLPEVKPSYHSVSAGPSSLSHPGVKAVMEGPCQRTGGIWCNTQQKIWMAIHPICVCP